MYKHGLFYIKKIKILISSLDTKRKLNVSKVPKGFHVKTSNRIRLLQSRKSEEPVPSSKWDRNSCNSAYQNQSTALSHEWDGLRSMSIKEFIMTYEEIEAYIRADSTPALHSGQFSLHQKQKTEKISPHSNLKLRETSMWILLIFHSCACFGAKWEERSCHTQQIGRVVISQWP